MSERKPGHIYLVFKEAPGPRSSFIEAEDSQGGGLRIGAWIEHDTHSGWWMLEIDPEALADVRLP